MKNSPFHIGDMKAFSTETAYDVCVVCGEEIPTDAHVIHAWDGAAACSEDCSISYAKSTGYYYR